MKSFRETSPLLSVAGGCLIAWQLCLFLSPCAFLSAEPAEALLACGRMGFLAGFALLLVLVSFTAPVRQALMTPPHSYLIAGGIAALGPFAAGLLCQPEITPVAWVFVATGYVLAGAAYACLFLGFCGALSAASRENLTPSVFPCVILGAVLYLLYSNLHALITFTALLLLPSAAGLALAQNANSPNKRRTGRSCAKESEARPGATESQPPMKWGTALNAACFWLAFGLAWPLGLDRALTTSEGLHSLSLMVAAITIAATVILAIAKKRLNLSHAVVVAIPALAIGVTVAAVTGSNYATLAFSLIFSARILVETELIAHFTLLCQDKRAAFPAIFTNSFFILSLGEIAGIIIGLLVGSFRAEGLFFALALVVNALVILLVLFISYVNKKLQLAYKAEAANPAEAASIDEARRLKAETFAKKYGLTKREAEVLDRILQGRNVPFIAEEFCVSQSTIQTHVKHIYTKMGVHDRQSLIDMMNQQG